MDCAKLWTRLGAVIGLSASVGAVVLLSGACEDSESGRSSYCRVFCERLEQCDDETDLAGCRDACKAQSFRSELYLETRANCASMSCNHWAAEVSSDGEDECSSNCELIDCVESNLERVKLSGTQEQLCEAVTNKVLSCDTSLDENEVRDDCQLAVASSSGDFLTDSRDCIDEPCAQIDRCLERLADQNNTTVRIFNGALQR